MTTSTDFVRLCMCCYIHSLPMNLLASDKLSPLLLINRMSPLPRVSHLSRRPGGEVQGAKSKPHYIHYTHSTVFVYITTRELRAREFGQSDLPTARSKSSRQRPTAPAHQFALAAYIFPCIVTRRRSCAIGARTAHYSGVRPRRQHLVVRTRNATLSTAHAEASEQDALQRPSRTQQRQTAFSNSIPKTVCPLAISQDSITTTDPLEMSHRRYQQHRRAPPERFPTCQIGLPPRFHLIYTSTVCQGRTPDQTLDSRNSIGYGTGLAGFCDEQTLGSPLLFRPVRSPTCRARDPIAWAQSNPSINLS